MTEQMESRFIAARRKYIAARFSQLNEMQQQAVALGIEEETQEQEEAEGGRKLSVDEVRSLILLLLSIVLWFFGYSAIISVILGIVGLIQASRAKELGYEDTTRTAGFILSLIGLIGGALAFVACVACVGLFASTGIAAGGLYAS